MQHLGSFSAAQRGFTSTVDELAAFGGTPAVRKDSVTAWPAASDLHLEALETVIKSGRFHRVNHPIVAELEERLAKWTNYWQFRAVATGTSAIHIALDCYKSGGRSVVTSALNWPGALGPIHFAGLQPIFVDVTLEDATLDPVMAGQYLSQDCASVLITHVFGNAAKLPAFRREVRRFGSVALVDDCAQAIGAVVSQRSGEPLDSDAIAISANGAKHLGAGELGLVCSRHADLIDHVDRVSLTSSSRNGERVFSPMTQGYNYRPNVFSSAVALSRMNTLDFQLAERRRNAAYVWSVLSSLPGLHPLFDAANPDNSFLSLPLRIDCEVLDMPASPATRDFILDLLKAEGVPVCVWLTKPAFEYLPYWRNKWSIEDFPNTKLILDTMFYISEIAPPNDISVMRHYVDAFHKVWEALPSLRSQMTKRN